MPTKKSLRRSGLTEPVQMAGIMLLFTIGVVTFPTSRILRYFGVGGAWLVLADGLERIAFSGVMLHFVFSFGFRIIPPKTRIIDVLAVLPAVIIAVNNFPFVSLFEGKLQFIGGGLEWISLAVYCLGVGLFEELAFRGVIMPLCLVKFREKKYPVMWTLIVSSAVFGLTHLVNLLGGGNVGATLFQVGYTFLIGAMCGAVALKTGNILFSVAVHVIYDFGGLMFSEFYGYGDPMYLVGSGDVWGSVFPPSGQMILTAVIGVVCGVLMLLVALSCERERGRQTAFYMIGDLTDN